MMATFSASDWRGIGLEIADALGIFVESASPPLSDHEATSALLSAASRLIRVMRQKGVPQATIECTTGLLVGASERRLNAIRNRLGPNRERAQVQTGPRQTAQQ